MGKQEFVWKVAGAAGEGIMTIGLLFSKTCMRHGLLIFDYTEYSSLIRGGHNTYQVHAGKDRIYTIESNVDILVALNKDAIIRHTDELKSDSVVIYDGENKNVDVKKVKLSAKIQDLPMVRLAKEAGGTEVMANNVALGASVFLAGLKLEILDDVIADVFGDKGEEVIDLNKKAAKAGYDYLKNKTQQLLTVNKEERQLLSMTGNEAIALGAIAGGLQFFVAYPMTPSSSILHYLAVNASVAKIVVKHAEDEISAANMAIGASFAGARAMVATSGGGFCYMVEALGLSGVAEVPIVFVEVMRPGPALGLPTWTEQGDLKFVLSASHGEFPRFVFAPGDAQEAFEISRTAQELAEKYQVPVIILSDKYLSESRFTINLKTSVFANKRWRFNTKPKVDESGFYPRYKPDEDGISNRTIPGDREGNYVSNSYVHNAYGLSSEESEDRRAQNDKLFKKFEKMKLEVPQQSWDVEPGAKITLIAFGSTKGVLMKAQNVLRAKNIPVNILNLSWIWPFPKEQVNQAIKSSDTVIVVEGNKTGQLADLIAQETGIIIKNRLNRYDGRPFDYAEIGTYVEKQIKK